MFIQFTGSVLFHEVLHFMSHVFWRNVKNFYFPYEQNMRSSQIMILLFSGKGFCTLLLIELYTQNLYSRKRLMKYFTWLKYILNQILFIKYSNTDFLKHNFQRYFRFSFSIKKHKKMLLCVADDAWISLTKQSWTIF